MSGKYSAACFFSAERRGRENGGESMTLEETCALMTSAEYKERFIAEYWQLRRRFEALQAILREWDAGTLNFTPTCPRSLYGLQISAMSEYLAVLEARAKIEGGVAMRLFVSVPTMGRSDEEVEAVKQDALRRVRETLDPSATLTDSYVSEDAPAELYGDRIGIWYLGESLKRLAESETAFFAEGWEAARGCRIERAVCEAYGVGVLDAPLLDRWAEKRKQEQWTRHESGVDPCPGGDAP